MMRTTLLVSLVALGACKQEYEPINLLDEYPDSQVQEIEAAIQTDGILQVQSPEVDVLFIIDNSGSMQEEQAALTSSFPEFMKFFSGSSLDYHMGVVSTDMDDRDHRGKLQGWGDDLWLDDTTTDAEVVFSAMATLGIGGSGDERGLDAAHDAVELSEPGGYNEGFIRDGAALHMIVISDEDDASDLSPDAFAAWANGLREYGELVSFSSIVNQPGCCSGGPLATESPGRAYMDATDLVGGVKYDIRSDDWDSVLEDLGVRASGLSKEFFLTQQPVEDTIEVWVVADGTTLTLDRGTEWTYNGRRNSVLMDAFTPPPLSEVFIRYEVLSGSVIEENR